MNDIDKPILLSSEPDIDTGYPPFYDEFWFEPISGLTKSGNSKAGAAEAIPAVFSAVDIYCKTFAMFPCNIYRGDDSRNTKAIAKEHPLFKVLRRRPNRLMNSNQYWRLVERHELLRGNHYSYIRRNGHGEIVELIPLHPDCVTVHQLKDDYEIAYKVKLANGKFTIYDREDIFHVRESSDDGLVGRSRIDRAWEAFRMAQAVNQQTLALFENDSRPLGVLQAPVNPRDKAQADQLLSTWEKAHKGPRRAGRVALLPPGFEFKPTSLTARDAQLIDIMGITTLDQVAMIFDIPPYRLQDFRRATFSNVESADIFWNKNSMAPRVCSKERAIEDQLLSDRDFDQGYFVKFNMDAAYRGDIKTRNEAYSTAIAGGWMTPNEARRREDLNPGEDPRLDQFRMQVNVQTLDHADARIEKDTRPDPEPEKDPEIEDPENKLSKSIKPVLLASFRRMINIEINAVKRALKKGNFLKVCETFYSKHQSTMIDELGNYIEAFDQDRDRVNDFISWLFGKRIDSLLALTQYANEEQKRKAIEGWNDEIEIRSICNFFLEGLEQ